MNGVAAKIAKEIGVFLKNDYRHTATRKQIAKHNASWSTTGYHTTRLQFLNHGLHG
jgi:hypothetical protein